MNSARILSVYESADHSRPTPVSAPQRILVVDDDPDIRQLNADVLIRSGYEVKVAEDGAVAWAALIEERYDLLITDNQMPNLTGLEWVKKLRASHLALPIVMATGALPPREEFGLDPWLQPDETLLKPYTIAELLRTVKAVLRPANGTPEADSRMSVRPGQPSEI